MPKRIHFMTLYGSSNSYTPTPHSAWAHEEAEFDVAAYQGGGNFVFSAVDMQPQQNYDALFGEGSSLSLLAAATRLIEVVDERMMLLEVPVQIDGPFLTDRGEVAVRFILGDLPASATPAKKEAKAKAEGEADPDAPKDAPKNAPKEPTPQEKLDAFINQLASQSKALTGKEFRLEGGADYLFISSEQLPAFFRASQKSWAGVDQIFKLLGIKGSAGQDLDLFERAALSMIIDTPDLAPDAKLQFELILAHLEETGSRLPGEFRRAYGEMSHAFSSIRELSTDLQQLRAALKFSAMPADAVSYMHSHSAFSQLLFQLIFVYSDRGSRFNERVTKIFWRYAEYQDTPPADKELAAFGLFMYGEFISRLAGMGNKTVELQHTSIQVLQKQRREWVAQRKFLAAFLPVEADDVAITLPPYGSKIPGKYLNLPRVLNVITVAAVIGYPMLTELIEEVDEELRKRGVNPEDL